MSRPLPARETTPGANAIASMVRFGIFTFDPLTRQVLAEEREALHLSPKAFDLLSILISRAPGVVSKGELHAELWPDTFVSDATLAGLVKELRRAFLARMPDACIIRTAHSVGFAFCAELTAHPSVDTVARRQWLLSNDRRLSLKDGENIIGRDPACDIWLDGSSVSRRHARIVIDGPCARIEDLGSKNGTRLRDAPVNAPARLSDGDEVKIGQFSLVYRAPLDGSTESVREQPGDRSSD